MRKRLTDVVVKKLSPPATGRLEVFDEIVPAMALRITSSGARSFVVRARVKGQPNPIRITLGDAAVMKLAEARDAASDAIKQCKRGIKPSPAKQAAGDAGAPDPLAWETVVARFLAEHASRNRSGDQTAAIFRTYVTPQWAGRSLPDISRANVAGLLDTLAAEKSVYVANRALAAVRKLFNWAVVRSLIPASPVVLGMAKSGEVRRDRVLTFDELAIVWKAAEGMGYPFAAVIHLLTATGQRRTEVAEMRWAAIDLDARTWTLAAADTKAARKHVVPLSDLAVDILAALPRISDGTGRAAYVFTTTGTTPVSGFGKAKAIMDRKIGKAMPEGQTFPAWRFHDLRRTVATHLADALGIAPHIVGAVLNHAPQGVTQRVYARGTMEYDMRRALQAWARLLRVLIEGGEPWRRLAPVLRPHTEADAAKLAELRRAIMADDDVWKAHLRGMAA